MGPAGRSPPLGLHRYTHLPQTTMHWHPRTHAVSGCTQHLSHMAMMVFRIVVPTRSWWGHQMHPLSIPAPSPGQPQPPALWEGPSRSLRVTRF